MEFEMDEEAKGERECTLQVGRHLGVRVVGPEIGSIFGPFHSGA